MEGLELIFTTGDGSEEQLWQFKDFAEMPWLAVDFNDKDLIGVEMLLQRYGVTCQLQEFTAVLLGSAK